MPVPKKSKASKSKPPEEILYPEPSVELCRGEDAMTAERMKTVLGWTEEEEGGEKFGDDFLLTDNLGKKVRCTNNTKNRPLSEPWAKTIAQDILNKHWKFNGETVVVGTYGQVLSGQHRGVGLILAEQERTGPQKLHWEDKWDGPVSIECVVVYGIDESGDTTRTLDNVKPRSLADVLFCDPTVFGKTSPSDRQQLCKMTDHAVKFLWHRTGAENNAFAPRRTHSEALDFIDRHSRIKRAVKHIHDEIKGKQKVGSLTKYVSPGYASGLLYLMGSGQTDGDLYHHMEVPSEKKIDWTLWEKACDFFVLLPEGDDLKALRYAFGEFANDDSKTGMPTFNETMALLIKAWAKFSQGEPVTKEDVRLKYWVDDDGIRHLDETPSVGGIDLGDPDEDVSEVEEGGADNEGEDPADEAEMEAKKAQERQRRIDEIKARAAERKAAKEAKTAPTSDESMADVVDRMVALGEPGFSGDGGEGRPAAGEEPKPTKMKKIARKGGIG